MKPRLTATLRGCLLGVALTLSLVAAAQPQVSSPAPQKVLRLSFPTAETGFDPAQVNDIYSRTVTPHIFEGLYQYDHLARPAKIRPLTADGMPQVSDDFRTWTVKIKPGIYFMDDPAFKGSKRLDAQGRRELTAADYVFSYKRFADPVNKSPVWGGMLDTGYVGLEALRKKALETKKPFDYEAEIEGIRALDRYTIQFKTYKPRPTLIETFATGDLFGAVARKVVEHYGDKIMAHPVGTGPFRLTRFVARERVEYARNDAYWTDKAKLDRVILLPIPEANARTAALLSNQVEAMRRPSGNNGLKLPFLD
mgnify:CR=1 FL=1